MLSCNDRFLYVKWTNKDWHGLANSYVNRSRIQISSHHNYDVVCMEHIILIYVSLTLANATKCLPGRLCEYLYSMNVGIRDKFIKRIYSSLLGLAAVQNNYRLSVSNHWENSWQRRKLIIWDDGPKLRPNAGFSYRHIFFPGLFESSKRQFGLACPHERLYVCSSEVLIILLPV